jgi:para-nitrobenzyl esterase
VKVFNILKPTGGLVVIVFHFGLCLRPPAADGHAANDALTLRIAGGQIHGASLDVAGATVRVFRGIPFAAPPVADLRWRPPQQVQPWKGTREAIRFAPACMQARGLAYGLAFDEQSEDCLYLNVWTAAKGPAERRPVMVWIHGGGNAIGGASAPVYDGRNFAAAGVVLVSIQYRLGALGYLAHPALTAEARRRDGHAASGNYGLMDQMAALKWVQANIGRFGGDKDCVTIFGESAGAANITFLMASPAARGLFHRAIAESGYFGENTPLLEGGSGLLKSSAHQSGIEFAQRVGVNGTDAQALQVLRALPAEKIASVPATIGSIGAGSAAGERAFRYGPVVDGYVLPRPPGEVWAAGQMQRVPFIAGSLLDDGWVFSRTNPIKGLAGYRLVLRTLFGSDFDRALQLFPANTDEAVSAAVERLITLLAFRAPARRLVRWIEAAGGDSWLYHFSHNPRTGRAASQGVIHGLEIPYVFNTLSVLGNATESALAADMLRRWVNFARNGNPNDREASSAGSSPNWPKYDKQADQHLEFGDPIRVETALDREACDFLDRTLQKQRLP